MILNVAGQFLGLGVLFQKYPQRDEVQIGAGRLGREHDRPSGRVHDQLVLKRAGLKDGLEGVIGLAFPLHPRFFGDGGVEDERPPLQLVLLGDPPRDHGDIGSFIKHSLRV